MFTRISNNRIAALTTSTSTIVTNILENAKKFGILPATLAKELSERESIITQLLISVADEKKVEGYFTDFLFVNKVPWSKTRDLMIKALGAPTNGADVEDVLDFALEHYKRKANISQTKQIIDDGLRLQSNSRLSNIFAMLKDALQNKPVSMLGIQFGAENMKDIFVFNRLVGLSLEKNEEDTEILRREFVKSLDELERTREVDDRYKAIFQALQSIEFNNQLSQITKFVTYMFEMQLQDPAMLAFRRVLVQLKLGVEFRRQFFSDFESSKTSDGKDSIRDTSGDPGQDAAIKELTDVIRRTTGYDNNYNFVRLSQNNPLPNEASIKAKVLEFLNDTYEKLEVVRVTLKTIKDSPGDPAFASISPQVKGFMDPSIEFVTQAMTKINKLKENIETLNKEKIFESFDKIWTVLGSNLVTVFNQLPDKFRDVNEFAKAMGINTEIFTNIFGILIGTETVKSAFTGNFKTAIMGALSLIAANNNFNKVQLSIIVGKSVPKSDNIVDAKALSDAFLSMNVNQNQVNDLLALKVYAEAVKATIQDRENTLVSKMTTAIKTNSDSQINAPLAANKDIQQEYSRFYEYLKLVNNNLSYYMDLVDALVKQARANPINGKKLLEQTGPVLQHRANIEALITEVRNKLSKYKSFKLIVKNVQKRNKLIMDLQVLIPELEKYMATGISIADLFLQPTGLRDKMREMSESLIEDRDKLFSEIEKIQKVQKLPVRFRAQPKTQKETPQFLGTNEQESMNPTFSTFDDRPK